jgi:hypothetical protein
MYLSLKIVTWNYWIIDAYNYTVLSPGGDICSCSVVSACDGTVPLRHEPVPVPPVSHSPALLWRVSVWYPGGPLWASPADCRLHTLAWRTGFGSQKTCKLGWLMLCPMEEGEFNFLWINVMFICITEIIK